MSVNLNYKSKKWEREIKELNQSKKLYNGDYYSKIDNFINRGFLETDPNNYCWLYGCLYREYGFISNYYIIDNDIDNVMITTYLSALALFYLKRLHDNHVETYFANIKNTLSEFEYAVCKFISIDCCESMIDFCNDSITANLFIGNEAKAKELVDQLPDNGDDIEAVYYREPIFLKNIYNAILNRDEDAFNECLAKRIKKYRKNMVGYSTIIDYASIALIKIAKKYGLNCKFRVIEISDIFFNKINTDELLKLQLPFYEDVKELL